MNFSFLYDCTSCVGRSCIDHCMLCYSIKERKQFSVLCCPKNKIANNIVTIITSSHYRLLITEDGFGATSDPNIKLNIFSFTLDILIYRHRNLTPSYNLLKNTKILGGIIANIVRCLSLHII